MRAFFRFRFAVIAPITLAAVLLISAAPAAAAPPDKVRERTATSFADTFVEIPGGFLFIGVANGEIFLDGFAESGGDCTFYFGGGFDDGFAVDSKLTGASIDATVFVGADTDLGCDGSIDAFAEDPNGTLSVDWTGVGDIHNFRSRESFTDDVCSVTFTGRGKSREAVADITLASSLLNVDIDGASGFLANSRDTFSLRCRA
jgi:hypothetical protein